MKTVNSNPAIPDVVRKFDAALPHFPDGRIDYRGSGRAAVINVVVSDGHKILLLKRSSRVGAYRGLWATIDGYYDRLVPVETMALTELTEEVGASPTDVVQVQTKTAFEIFDPAIHRTWIVHPVYLEIKHRPRIQLDWEHTEYRWVQPQDLGQYDTIKGLDQLITHVWPSKPSPSSRAQ
ncbi:MAG: NUDIX domain-containing protein [Candidatus Kerfeldbacteria bacterium]|nr:NUDIX domain-containing protein [Candidatus Kerfeldbacteria bacterium]